MYLWILGESLLKLKSEKTIHPPTPTPTPTRDTHKKKKEKKALSSLPPLLAFNWAPISGGLFLKLFIFC